jgi:apolipoprotein N-acyltransferase
VTDATGAGGRFGGADAPRSREVPKKRETARGWYWLLVVPFFGTFFPWIYNTESPELFGIPFFWWYQMAWVPISAVLTILVYRGTTKRGEH